MPHARIADGVFIVASLGIGLMQEMSSVDVLLASTDVDALGQSGRGLHLLSL